MKKLILLAITAFATHTLLAQKEVKLHINHKIGTENLGLGEITSNDLGETFRLSRVDYYISGISILHDNGQVTPVTDKYILARGTNNVSETLGTFDLTDIEGIRFHIGVDTPLNNADPSLQPNDHPLSFQIPSMHWGWSTGYRYLCLEGTTGSNFDVVFELHGLWRENYFEQTVMTSGISDGNSVTIVLDADYVKALKGISVASGPLEHGVNRADLAALENFRDHVFSAGTTITSVATIEADPHIFIYPNPARATLTIDAGTSVNKLTRYDITDMMGRSVQQGTLNNQQTISVQKLASGTYFVNVYAAKGAVMTKKIVIE
jgi:hypothetical protein